MTASWRTGRAIAFFQVCKKDWLGLLIRCQSKLCIASWNQQGLTADHINIKHWQSLAAEEALVSYSSGLQSGMMQQNA